MLMKLFKKTVIILLLTTFILSLLPVSQKTYAETASKTTNSMIDFFRTENTQLTLDRVSSDELLVYGVFISNFFVPGQTTIGDLVGEDKEGIPSISSTISQKFFGSTGNVESVKGVNKKLYDAMTGVLSSSEKKRFGLYSKPYTDGSSPMTGLDFYKKMSGADADKKVYGGNLKTVLDLGDKSTNAAFQVLFGFSPELILAKDGLRSFTGMYLDGLGNIWGSYESKGHEVGIDEYVLLLPAALNPVVFSATTTNTKFPVSNTFVMGGVLKITEDFLSGLENKQEGQFLTAYYNVKKYFKGTSDNTSKDSLNVNNMLNILGVRTPIATVKSSSGSTSVVGSTNNIILNANSVTSNPINSVKEFIEKSSADTFSEKEATIILSLDPTKFDASPYFDGADGSDLKNNDQKYALFDYLYGGSSFTLSELDDAMYYFNSSGSGATGHDTEWSGTDTSALFKPQRLFAKEEKSGEFNFFSGSSFISPFSRFYSDYISKKTAGEKESFLKTYLEEKVQEKINIDSEKSADYQAFHYLESFLDTGLFTQNNTATTGASKFLINDAMDLLQYDKAKYESVYNVVPTAEYTASTMMTDDHSFWTLGLANKISPSSFGLTKYDNLLSYISLDETSGGLVGKPPYGPFIFNGSGGGSIGSNAFTDIMDVNSGYVDVNAQNAISTLFHSALTYTIFSMNKTFLSYLKPDLGANGLYPGATFKTPLRAEKFQVKTAVMNGVNNYPGMYWGYMITLLQVKNKPDINGKDHWVSQEYKHPLLPNMPISSVGGNFDINSIIAGSGVVASEDKSMKEMQTDIVKKVYGLLSDGPNSYRDKLVKSMQDSWIISTHRSITGSWVGNLLSVSSGGNSSYASIVGYINTPSLHDLPLTNWLLKDYMFIYLFMLLLVLIVLILMVMSNIRTLREGVLIFIVMSFVLVLPQFLVSNTINLSNSVGDKLYAGRFSYWAITQHQQAFTSLQNARSSGDELDYIIAKSMQANEAIYSTDVGVRVKWMAPKRTDVFDGMFNKTTMSDSLLSNLTMFRWLFSSVMNQEEYVYNDPLATYVYRPYNSIALEAKNSFTALSASTVAKKSFQSAISTNSISALSVPPYRFELILDTGKKVEFTKEQGVLVDAAGTYPTGSTDKDAMNNYRYWAINSPDVTKAIFNSKYPEVVSAFENLSDPYYSAFSLSTESPFYYFYNLFMNRYGGGTQTFKSSLLKEETFRVDSTDREINNKMRDFLDMEGLFTYVIPYLHQGNEYVAGWTGVYGTSIDTFDFGTVAPKNEVDAKGNVLNDKNGNKINDYNDAFTIQSKKKESLKQIWKMYSPWVDQMYDLNIMNKQVSIANKKVSVEDTLNPASFSASKRPMIFSEADMNAKSYRIADLTDTELRIQRTLETTYKDLMYLTNYYDFKDEVLVTAAAMMATFNFNREFSDPKVLGNSVMIYPQSFELKNFNYDAFMRLILLNSTGEPLMADKDLYVRILDKTSLFTGILLIVCDLMAVILIPTMKVIVLLLLLLLSMLISVSCVITPPDKIAKVIMKSLGLPSLLFLISSGIFSFIISIFMGEGLTSYVGGRAPSLGVTDPTVTLGLIVVVDGVFLFILWKTCKFLLDSFKTHLTKSLFTTLALATGVGASVVNGTMSKLKNGVSGAIGYGLRNKKYNKMLDAVKGNGVGGSSGAGSSGGSSDGSSSDDGSSSIRSSSSNENDSTNGVRDEDFSNRVEDLASRKADSSPTGSSSSNDYTSPVQPDVRKPIGNRIVDLKYKLQGSLLNAKDSVHAHGRDAYNSSKGAANKLYQKGKDTYSSAQSLAVKAQNFSTSDAREAFSSVKESASQKAHNTVLSVKKFNTGVRDSVGSSINTAKEYTAQKKRDAVLSVKKYKNGITDYNATKKSEAIRERNKTRETRGLDTIFDPRAKQNEKLARRAERYAGK
jgi:hypothetical protein